MLRFSMFFEFDSSLSWFGVLLHRFSLTSKREKPKRRWREHGAIFEKLDLVP